MCINASTKYSFYFNLHITEYKPTIFRSHVYFIIQIDDDGILVDEKIFPVEIIVKVTHNHLKLHPFHLTNCLKENSLVTVKNNEMQDVMIIIQYKRKIFDEHN